MTTQPDPGIWDDAEIIYAYTRTEALEDGTLVDVSRAAREKGFRYPVAITASLYTRLEPDEYEQSQGQSYTGRLHDVLWMAYLAARKSAPGIAHMNIEVSVAERRASGKGLKHNKLTLWAAVDGGDDGQPVITIGFPEDF